jgi:lipopolysaccharide transport system ATP-binding protein
MSSPVIRVENLSKLYRLGEIGTGSLAHDINRWWHRIRGKEDPYSQVGQINDRTRKSESDWVWALKDINFEVKQGEVLGIIGRNGAGKSTLLKILSRVTAQTTGQIKVKGRIASLLEVGTGFHPDLTGRENIYLNGAILGMRTREIDRKLDEIVAFSGCEAYLDTPVKRYSSGMQVRLAFAVAAHLEPEILIVDEVLAVGDIEFQRKCLGKMQEVSSAQGRTILFVSHNLGAVRRLCTRAVWINSGSMRMMAPVSDVLAQYVLDGVNTSAKTSTTRNLSGRPIKSSDIAWLSTISTSEETTIAFWKPLKIIITIEVATAIDNVAVGVGIDTLDGQRVLTIDSDVDNIRPRCSPGKWAFEISIPSNPLGPGSYAVHCALTSNKALLDTAESCAFWTVAESEHDFFSDRGFAGCRLRPESMVSKIST